jgi:hypothetical protein
MTEQYDDSEMEKAKQDFWRDIKKAQEELSKREDKEWIESPPVGKEFGSEEYEEEQSKDDSLIEKCNKTASNK